MHLVLLLAAAALASPVQAANVNRNLKMLPGSLIVDSIESYSQTQKPSGLRMRKSLELTHHSPPIERHIAGRVLELHCEANGSPMPSVTWLRNNRPILEFDQESNEMIDVSPTSIGHVLSTLIISKPSHTESDVYTCLVSAGRRTESFSTTVYNIGSTKLLSERYKLLPLEPRIVNSYKMYMDYIGNNAVLPCKAKGHPRPLVTWFNGSGELIENDSRRKILRSGELLISRLRWSDMGEYTCVATNSFGSQNVTSFVYPFKAG